MAHQEVLTCARPCAKCFTCLLHLLLRRTQEGGTVVPFHSYGNGGTSPALSHVILTVGSRMDYSLCATAAPGHPVRAARWQSCGLILLCLLQSVLFTPQACEPWFSALAAHWTQQCLGPSGPAGQNRRGQNRVGRGPGTCHGSCFESSQQTIFPAPMAFTRHRI